jgi:hypothetical protein
MNLSETQFLPLEPIQDALDSCTAHLHASTCEVEEAIVSLIKESQVIADEYFKIFLSTSGQHGNDIGALMPSIKKKESVNGPTLEIRWIRSVKGAVGRIRNTINKGSGFSYSVNKLTRKSPDWEKDLIVKTEAQFCAIRELYTLLIKSRINSRAIKKALIKNNEIFD